MGKNKKYAIATVGVRDLFFSAALRSLGFEPLWDKTAGVSNVYDEEHPYRDSHGGDYLGKIQVYFPVEASTDNGRLVYSPLEEIWTNNETAAEVLREWHGFPDRIASIRTRDERHNVARTLKEGLIPSAMVAHMVAHHIQSGKYARPALTEEERVISGLLDGFWKRIVDTSEKPAVLAAEWRSYAPRVTNAFLIAFCNNVQYFHHWAKNALPRQEVMLTGAIVPNVVPVERDPKYNDLLRRLDKA